MALFARNDTEMMGGRNTFQTTSWSLVRSIQDVKALDALISIYWKPLYFFVRQKGNDNETAKDIVQDFLTSLLSKHTLQKADATRGRFRTFLLAALENFMKDRLKSASREKRGGGQKIVSLDFSTGEKEYTLQVRAGEAPETVLNRAWARSLWEDSLARLQGEASHLEALKMYLADSDYKHISAKTGLSESAAKTAVHRLRGQLRTIITNHIRETVSTDEDLRGEVAEFMELLR
ncbi:MAG TPA: sigma-70 family RNA polymerase sigma factor [Planctomycetota bacterium]|nr:sigma-70 family RNA polymerase sigma factor [Planctomycetota bacterium]